MAAAKRLAESAAAETGDVGTLEIPGLPADDVNNLASWVTSQVSVLETKDAEFVRGMAYLVLFLAAVYGS